MVEVISGVEAMDVRFPASHDLDGLDALNPEPGYAAAYVTLRTSDGQQGYGLAVTVGRGNDVQVAAVRALAPLVVGMALDDVIAGLGRFSRRLTGDSRLRWLGPDNGVMHTAAAAIVNATWDLYARKENKPVWRLLAEMSPQQLVELVDFRYLQDALTPEDALKILRRAEPGRQQRRRHLLEQGYPAYAGTPGWLGDTDEKLVHLAKQAVADRFGMIKVRAGTDRDADMRRLRLVREAVGPGVRIAVDADQAWGVTEAICRLKALAPFDPYWIEEPTSPDDVLGHAAIRAAVGPIRVATGGHVANQVMFKQLLQAGAVDVVQIDAGRVAGVTENIAILLLAAKYGVPVCAHAGGTGLGEMVQHLAMFDYVSVSRTTEGRMIEYVDHLHEHFADPVVIRDGHYVAPTGPGLGARMRPDSVAAYRYPDGPQWASRRDVAPP